jgi:hypothetical protein
MSRVTSWRSPCACQRCVGTAIAGRRARTRESESWIGSRPALPRMRDRRPGSRPGGEAIGIGCRAFNGHLLQGLQVQTTPRAVSALVLRSRIVLASPARPVGCAERHGSKPANAAFPRDPRCRMQALRADGPREGIADSGLQANRRGIPWPSPSTGARSGSVPGEATSGSGSTFRVRCRHGDPLPGRADGKVESDPAVAPGSRKSRV